jgi:hypothetical protein
MTILPENLLKLMSPADRKQYGRAGWTAEDCQERVDLRLERKLHADFSGFLRRHEFGLVIHTDPRKKSPIRPGWPDFSIFSRYSQTLFIEFKVGDNTLSTVQEEVIAELRAAGFTVLVLHNYADAVEATLDFFIAFDPLARK